MDHDFTIQIFSEERNRMVEAKIAFEMFFLFIFQFLGRKVRVFSQSSFLFRSIFCITPFHEEGAIERDSHSAQPTHRAVTLVTAGRDHTHRLAEVSCEMITFFSA